MSKSWESASLVVVVLQLISSGEQVLSWSEVCEVWPQQSVKGRLRGLGVSASGWIVLLHHLLVDFWVVANWFLNHCWEWLQVWSRVELVVQDRVVCPELSHQETADDASQSGVSAEESVSGSVRTHVGPVFNPSLIWDYWNSALILHHSPADENGEGISDACSDQELGHEVNSVLPLELLEVLEWIALGAVHVLLGSDVEPGVTQDVVLEPIMRSSQDSITYHLMYSISVSLSGCGGIAISKMYSASLIFCYLIWSSTVSKLGSDNLRW